jgi:predicted enzyme related to lactoylglutathione lyase
MSDASPKQFKNGSILSIDLTVDNTEQILDFYKQVVGWDSEGLTMHDEQGEYADYVTKDEDGNWVGGICHRRGMNADLPPVWIVYIQVADVEASLQRCEALGGSVLKCSLLEDGSIQYALIQDPAGAVLALTQAM